MKNKLFDVIQARQPYTHTRTEGSQKVDRRKVVVFDFTRYVTEDRSSGHRCIEQSFQSAA